MLEIIRDIRYALRSFGRRPLFTAVLVLTLALGIGSNVAIFSVANAVIFAPLPYEDPEELALIWTRLPNTDVDRTLVSGPDFMDYRLQSTAFEDFAGAFALAGTITNEGRAEQLMMGWTTPNLFDVLGIRARLGRNFRDEDTFPIDPSAFGSPNPDLPPGAVMLSHSLWMARFGGDPDIVGQTVVMDGWAAEIVGVLPESFRIYLPADAGMPTDIDAWRVMPSNASDFGRDSPWVTVVGRLRPGFTTEQAQQDMDRIAADLRALYQFHANADMQIVVNGMHEDVVSHARPALLSLLGAVAFVLLIACSNVANLLLVRASARDREIAVRAALGGGRWRIVRQMLTESAVLAVGGALVGVLLAWWGVRAMIALTPANLPRAEQVAIDPTVLGFTALVTAVAALLFGSVPALRALSSNLAESLKDRGADSGGVRGNKLRTVLVVAEIALSIVLLVGAGLMLRSFAEIRRAEPGFDPSNVLTFEAAMPFMMYPNSETRGDFVNQFGRRLAEIPGVQSVGGVTPLPLSGGDQYSVGSYGKIGDPDEVYQSNKADMKAVLPGYLETMDIELVSGRTLTLADNEAEAQPVVVVDRKLAERLWGTEDPVGKQILRDAFDETDFSLLRLPAQVVGVVENARSASLAEEGRETIYLPYRLLPWLPLTYTLRTSAPVDRIVQAVRETTAAIDPEVPISNVRLMEGYVTDATAETRFMLTLVGIFAGIALLLASLGLYGVIAYSVRQRTREIGVRVAFGASDADVFRLVLRSGLILALFGIIVGVGASLALTRVVESLLVGVRATDPLTFVSIPLVLLVVSIVATWIPARRAVAIDPVSALRDE